MQIVAAALRITQFLFSVVILGLSVTLITNWATKEARDERNLPGVPATTEYDAFTGGWGMLVALVGLASIWVELLQGIIMIVLDVLAALFFLAGGIATAVKLRGVHCGTGTSDAISMFENTLVNGGCNFKDDYCYYTGDKRGIKSVANRCRMNEADTVFMFLTFFVCLALVAHTFFFGGRAAGRRSVV